MGLLWKIPLALVTMGTGAVLVFVFVFLDRDRVLQVFGKERGSRLHVSALTMVANLPAPDRDRDGIADWVRLHGPLSRDVGLSIGSKFADKVFVYQGERTKVRIWNRSFGVHGVWAPGFRARVSADRPMLFLPGSTGPASKGPLELVASPSGALDFEVLAPDSQIEVELINSANGEWIGPHLTAWKLTNRGDAVGFVECVGQRLPSVECRISDKDVGGLDPTGLFFVDFDLVPGATSYVLEISTPNQPNEWHPIQVLSGPQVSSMVKFYAEYHRATFRIVPTK